MVRWPGQRTEPPTFRLALSIARNLFLTDLWTVSAGAQSRGQGGEDAGVQLTRGGMHGSLSKTCLSRGFASNSIV